MLRLMVLKDALTEVTITEVLIGFREEGGGVRGRKAIWKGVGQGGNRVVGGTPPAYYIP